MNGTKPFRPLSFIACGLCSVSCSSSRRRRIIGSVSCLARVAFASSSLPPARFRSGFVRWLIIMALDSSATFASRVRDLGLSSLLDRFLELGWTNLGALAFSAGTPGAPSSEAAFEERVILPLVGSSAGPQAALVRRLYFEATTLAASDMRRRVDRVDDETVPPLPTEEREARRARLQARLVGVDIIGDLDPSPSLVHAAHTMSVSGVVKYVPWETCTKFSQEAYLHPKKRLGWAPDASGVVKEHASAELLVANVNTTHLLSQALIRRGLAFEIGMVMTFEVHESVRRSLLDALCEDPPPGYASASMAQLERADTCLFAKLGEYTRTGIRGVITSGLPLDGLVSKILESSKYNMLLMPLARASGAAASSSSAQGSDPPAQRAQKNDKQATTIENLRRQVENLKRKQSDQGGRAKKQKHAQNRAQLGQDNRAGPMPMRTQGSFELYV